MFAKYVSLTTSTQVQVIADLAALLSGASIASLSASCDKINTTVLSTVAPGWTIVDANPGLSGQVISAPDANGLTTKFVRLFAPTAATIQLAGYESWNSTAKTGTNVTAQSGTTSSLSYSATAFNTYVVFATPRSVFICTSGGVGVGAFEFTRDCAYLVGSTYPCFAILPSTTLAGGSVAGSLLRLKNLSGTGDLTSTSAQTYPGTISTKYINYSTPGRSPTSIVDATGVAYFEVRPMWATAAVSTFSAVLGKLFDVSEISASSGATLDTFSDGASTYVIVNLSTSALAFKMA